VTVNAPAANVTLSANSQTVVYGDSTSLSGAVTNQLTNEQVSLTSQPYGKGTQSIATTTTQANGVHVQRLADDPDVLPGPLADDREPERHG
jgi:hypothetical protein